MTLLTLRSDVSITFQCIRRLRMYKKAQDGSGDIHLLNWSNCAWKWGKYPIDCSVQCPNWCKKLIHEEFQELLSSA